MIGMDACTGGGTSTLNTEFACEFVPTKTNRQTAREKESLLCFQHRLFANAFSGFFSSSPFA